MSYTITPIPAFEDNYIWLVQKEQSAIVIDPGAAQPVLDFVRTHALTIEQIWITHHHDDHIGGVAELAQVFPDALIFGAQDIEWANEIIGEGSEIQWRGIHAAVWHTPGHTAQHVCFVAEISARLHVFCGDTLFRAGCGRAFTQRADWLYHSLARLNTLPEKTLFYPAHEYTAANLRFAAAVEPDNADIRAALIDAKKTPTLPTRLADERAINPFLRTHVTQVKHAAEQFSGSLLADEEAVFIALRQWKNEF